jgi:hypothetical protein
MPSPALSESRGPVGKSNWAKPMKYLLLVHHDDAAIDKIIKDKQPQMLAESVALTQRLIRYFGRSSLSQLSQQIGARP